MFMLSLLQSYSKFQLQAMSLNCKIQYSIAKWIGIFIDVCWFNQNFKTFYKALEIVQAFYIKKGENLYLKQFVLLIYAIPKRYTLNGLSTAELR